MKNPDCFICKSAITEANRTKEHIIPHAIGGRRKTTGFICMSCNNSTGANWDSDLADQLLPFGLLFSIVRERADVPSKKFHTTNGGEILLHRDGRLSETHPIFDVTPGDGEEHIYIAARSEKEARRMLRGYERKNPEFNFDAVQSEHKYSYCEDPIQVELGIGQGGAGRAIVKSALALACSAGIDLECCELAARYLQGDDTIVCYGAYYARDLIAPRPKEPPFHCIAVKGSSNTGLLIAYVEFYSLYRIVLCLSDTYQGEDLDECYAINPSTGREVQITVDLTFSKEEIQGILENNYADDSVMHSVAGEVLAYAMALDLSREIARLVERGATEAFTGLSLEEVRNLQPSHVDRVTREVMAQMEPLIRHLVRLPPKN